MKRPFLALVVALFATAFAIAQQPQPPASATPPREKAPDVMGRIVDVSADGKILTIAIPPKPAVEGQPPARDAKPEEAKVNLTEQTKTAFFGVGEDQARPAAGLMAMVWLAEGSKDQAARVRFMKREGEDRPDVAGRITAVAPDGRTITVETRERDPQTGNEKVTGQATVKLAPYTFSQYFNVEANGAKPTVDYSVLVWLEKGSKETAARVRFMRPER